MAKAKDHIIAKAPTSFEDIERFLNEMSYLTAKLHGKKYRFMYQVFKGVNVHYKEYANELSNKLGMPADYIQGMTYIFVRACVHYALFEDEEYLNLQLNAIRSSLKAYIKDKKEERK